VILGGALAALAFVACIGLVVVGVAAGALLHTSERATGQAAVPASATARVDQQRTATALQATSESATSEVLSSPLATPTPVETAESAAVPVPEASPSLTGTAGLSGTLPAGETLLPAGEPGSPADAEPAAASAASALVQLMSEPGPSLSLELTPTTELTLSSVVFVENAGQLPAEARFQVRGQAAGGLWLAPDGLWLTLLEGMPAFGDPPPGEATAPYWQDRTAQRGVALKLSFEGANPAPQLVPFEPLDTRVSYFRGDDPAKWRTGVPVWGGVRYVDLYPGIDLELRGEGSALAQRLVVHPGADLNVVRLRVEGAEALTLEPISLASGDQGRQATTGYILRLTTALGDVSLPLFQVLLADGAAGEMPTLPAPRLSGDSRVVEAPFVPAEALQAKDDGPFNLLYTSLLGAGGNVGSLGIAVDEAGQAYITGYAYQPAFFATAGSFETAAAGDYDAFVVKIGAGGRDLAYAAFLGGTGDETGDAVAVDGAGRAIVAGVSDSPDLPATTGGPAGGLDAFVARLSPAGDALDYLTYLGGSEFDRAWAVAVDVLGNAYVAGATDSPNLPVSRGSLDTTLVGRDGFVAKIDAAGSLAWATYLGGSDADQALGIAVSGVGNAYVVGATHSTDFPVTSGAFDTSLGGDDAFVAKLNADGAGLAYATFLGGGDDDVGRTVAVDADGRATVAGSTTSPDFPTTPGSFDASFGGGSDAFLARLDATGSGLDYAAFLGDGGDDWGLGVTLGSQGDAYLAGASPTFPADNGAATLAGFVARVDTTGTRLAYASALGSSEGPALGLAVAVDPLGSAYVAGMGQANGLWQARAAKLVLGAPFLDLPVPYTNFARAALGNVGDRGPGLVNSWFDHRFPDHSENQKLTRWDGVDLAITASSPMRIGESWYDGHGGIDFRRSMPDESIYAAAPGTVIDTVTTCRVGQTACGAYFGNRVWIDHGNGYATVYAHLKSVSVAVGERITDPTAQPLGSMGNTGRSLGTHLHFGLYFDANHDGRWTYDEGLDPYGWAGAGRDPAGGPGWYLWRQPLAAQQLVGGAAAPGEVTLLSPTHYATATLPAGEFAAPVLLELWDVLPAARPQAGWYATGRAFWLRSETEPGLAFAEPVQLTVDYRDKDMVHLDPSRLTLFRWDESRNAWASLPTSVDVARHQVHAETDALGRFDLHAPLLCPADSHEPDDHYGAALDVPVSGQPVTRVLDIEADVDWFRFVAEAGQVYVAQVDQLAGGVRAVVQLYDADGSSVLASGDVGEGGALFLKWWAPADGTYLLQVSPAEGSAFGCDASYRFRLTRIQPPGEVAVAGPEDGLPGATYSFTATVGPATVATPITYTWQVAGQPPLVHTAGLSDTQTLAWPAPGVGHVVVTATNAAGSAVGQYEVTIHVAVQAAFQAAPLGGEAPLAVEFTNTSTGDYTASLWDFGDGSSSKAKSPSHTYSTPGEYTVTLTVSGPGGVATATEVAYIKVTQGRPPMSGAHVVYLPLVVNRH
jgi:murein DD-endopeptidase MepM/ murein hydrolase activator NlpD